MLSGTTPRLVNLSNLTLPGTSYNFSKKHFPDSNPLHKLFNRNTVKVSDSCMPNVKSAISRHNNQMLSKTKTTPETENCNCQKPSECPLNKKCLSSNIVYKAVVTSAGEGETKEYIGMTATTFKTRYRNHKKSFNYTRYEKDTALSKHIWELKRSNKSYTIIWSILKRASSYQPGRTRCNLCIEEKLCILQDGGRNLLNKRSEIFAKCRHREKFWAGNFERAHGQ